MYPELIPGGVYRVNCNWAHNASDDWAGTCRVIDVSEDDHVFFIERIKGLVKLIPEQGGVTFRIGIGSHFHETMTLIDDAPVDIKIEYSIEDLIGE